MKKIWLVVAGVVVILAAVSCIILLSGCQRDEIQAGVEGRAIMECQRLCNDLLAGGEDLGEGPCIGDADFSVAGWVCDVAHNPREDVDNQPENQCSAFRSGDRSHFVEVDPNCTYIKHY